MKPNRAQQILYGPTLEPYLYGEQIAHALVNKSQLAPLVICTDLNPVLAVRSLVSTPVALVLPADSSEPKPEFVAELGSPEHVVSSRDGDRKSAALRFDDGHATNPRLHLFAIGSNRLAVAVERETDRAAILERLGSLESLFDLHEPFDRIRKALEEAQRGGR